jgi:hypothetical protein
MTLLTYKKIRAIRLGLLNLVLVSLTQVCLARLDTAEMEITVSDPSGAAVSGAKVRVENTANGSVREVTTFALVPNRLRSSFQGLITEAENYRTTEETYFYSTRFDHQISTNHKVFVRISGSPSDLTGIPSNGQYRLASGNLSFFSLKGHSPAMIWNMRFTQERKAFQPIMLRRRLQIRSFGCGPLEGDHSSRPFWWDDKLRFKMGRSPISLQSCLPLGYGHSHTS